VPAWIAQLWLAPAEIAEALPAVPSTEGGGVACPASSSSSLALQQTTAPVPAWIAQAW
jgi:hypothetical protein